MPDCPRRKTLTVPLQDIHAPSNLPLCYALCRSRPYNAQRTSAPLLTVCVWLPSEPLGTVLHNLSWDSGDFFTTLSILLYLLCYLTPCSDYLHMYTSWPRLYFHSSSGSSINSSTIVGSTQMKNLVVFQFRLRLHANLLLFPL